ncbi:MAG TPA: hypothetical protein VF158_10780 [Longimicrobiales bacterium]
MSPIPLTREWWRLALRHEDRLAMDAAVATHDWTRHDRICAACGCSLRAVRRFLWHCERSES